MNDTHRDDETTRTVEALRLEAGRPPCRQACRVVVEAPLTVDVEDVGAYTILSTPCDRRALAVGFAFTEGIIDALDDILLLEECDDDRGVIRLRVRDAGRAASRRNMVVTSSCGLCGSRDMADLIAGLPACGDSYRVSAAYLAALPSVLRERQGLFAATGGTHAAAVVSADGEVIAFAEDIGRHNALDKAVGLCLLSGRATAGCSAVLSSRVSFELVAKAARGGIELIAAVSAPSALAIEAAARCRITLCAFVRGDRTTVFTHPDRIQEMST